MLPVLPGSSPGVCFKQKSNKFRENSVKKKLEQEAFSFFGWIKLQVFYRNRLQNPQYSELRFLFFYGTQWCARGHAVTHQHCQRHTGFLQGLKDRDGILQSHHCAEYIHKNESITTRGESFFMLLFPLQQISSFVRYGFLNLLESESFFSGYAVCTADQWQYIICTVCVR